MTDKDLIREVNALCDALERKQIRPGDYWRGFIIGVCGAAIFLTGLYTLAAQ